MANLGDREYRKPLTNTACESTPNLSALPPPIDPLPLVDFTFDAVCDDGNDCDGVIAAGLGPSSLVAKAGSTTKPEPRAVPKPRAKPKLSNGYGRFDMKSFISSNRSGVSFDQAHGRSYVNDGVIIPDGAAHNTR